MTVIFFTVMSLEAETEKPETAESAATAPTPKPVPPPVKKPEPKKQHTYTVKSGDSLSRIANRFYGDPTRWQLIYQANRSRMKNERDLRVGQVLIVPEP